jgi:hypothetical protein
MAQYKTGTVSLANGQSAVTLAAGDVLSAGIKVGDIFTVPGLGYWHEIASITDGTHFTISGTWGGATLVDSPYVIAQSFTPILNLPYPEAGDIETGSLIKRALLQIESAQSFNFAYTSTGIDLIQLANDVQLSKDQIDAIKLQIDAIYADIQTRQTNVQQLEALAEGSQIAAAESENKAQLWAEEVTNVEVEPGQFSAKHHAENAAASEASAAASETNAAASETNAGASETAAAASESSAQASALAASTSETNAAGSEEAAGASALAASNSETAAAASESNAVTSAILAGTSETNAATSETNALASENKALQWAENPEDIEVEVGKFSALHHARKSEASNTASAQSALEALNSSNAAAVSETNSATSESNAATSEANAAASETNAASSETFAHLWAENAENVEVKPGEFSAKHWALQAQAAATGALHYLGKHDASTGVYPSTPSLGDFYKISVAGTISGTVFAVGDSIIFNGTTWDKVDNTESVTSVGGYVGAVTASQLLAAIKTVDGIGSGLDADTLGGKGSTMFMQSANTTILNSTDDLNSITAFGRYGWSGVAPINSPDGILYGILVVDYDGAQPVQKVYGMTDGRIYLRRRNNGVWPATWERVLTSSMVKTSISYDVTTSFTDTTANRLLKVGDFGLTGLMAFSGDMNTLMTNGQYNVSGASTNRPAGAITGGKTRVFHRLDNGEVLQIFTENVAGAIRQYARHYIAGVWGDWDRFLMLSDFGSGNGIDSDMLDGLHASSFLRSDIANSLYSVTPGNGNGMRFWNSELYKIYMSSTADTTWGGSLDAASDYNMYFQMDSGANRGFVFKNAGAPVAQIDGSGKGYFAGGMQLGKADGTQGILNLYGYTAGTVGKIKVTNGNMHIDPHDASSSLYLNWYQGNSVRFGNGAGSGEVGKIDNAGNMSISGTMTIGGSLALTRANEGSLSVAHAGTAGSAAILATARTISISGDVSGSVAFNGSANVNITATVADDSHNHIIANVDGLQAALDGKLSTTGTAANSNTLGGISASGFLRSNAADTLSSTLNLAGDIVVPTASRNRGVFGTYDYTKTQHIWSMGTAYRNAADGSSFGNLYGIAYKYGGAAGGHGQYCVSNGSATAGWGTNIWTSGNVTAYSDIRVKTNIETIPDALEKVKKLGGYTFDRTDVKQDENGNDLVPRRQTGVIAQEVLKVLPEAALRKRNTL